MIDLDKQVPGPELDALVAEKVMGLKVLGKTAVAFYPSEEYTIAPPSATWTGKHFVALDECCCESWDDPSERNIFGHGSSCLKPVPFYSTEVATAFEIVEKLRLEKKGLTICASSRGYDVEWFPGTWESAAEAPLAICRAALRAVGA